MTLDTVSKEDAMFVLDLLELSLLNHEVWFECFVLDMTGNDNFNKKFLEEDGHTKCNMSKNLAEVRNILGEPRILQDILFIHEQLHAIVRKLSLTSTGFRGDIAALFDEVLVKRRALRWSVRTLSFQLKSNIVLIDPLTGAFNRTRLMTLLERELENTRRAPAEASLCFVDIDFFKRVNDTHGHHAGDRVLTFLVHFFKTHLRTVDVVFRYGGEEFVLFLQNTDLETARQSLDRIRTILEKAPIQISVSQKIYVTASFGVVPLDGLLSVEDNLKKADEALYRAKNSGRNRVSL